MAADWFDPLREYARKASREHPSYGEDAVLYFQGRWCQKIGDSPEPDPSSFGEKRLAEVAREIARNLASDGKQVEVVFALNQQEYDRLKRLLADYARRCGAGNADQYADEGLMKVLPLVFTGTRPSCAGCKLECRRRTRPECAGCIRELGLNGPSNEYVFQAPFLAWVLAVVRHLIADDARHNELVSRWRRDLIAIDEACYASWFSGIDTHRAEAYRVVRALLKAIDGLPPMQRSVMILSMCRADVDDAVHAHLHRRAPTLLGRVIKHRRFASDEQIADYLGTTAGNIASARAVARTKLVAVDPRWGNILDYLLPHRSYSLALSGTND